VSGALTRFARRWWSGAYGWGGSVLSAALLPASGAWRLVTAVRNWRFDRRGGERVAGARIVSVGNLAVGGTGKTPFASWVARTLAESGGRRPAIVLRGYGMDEVLLHAAWTPEIPVVARADRVQGAREAAAAGATAIVLDDGFQHRRLGRDLDLVLLSVEDPWPPRVLPLGPYREPAASLARADAIVLTRRSAPLEEARRRSSMVESVPGVRPGVVLGCVSIVNEAIVPLTEGVLRERAGRHGHGPELTDVLAVTAIARPEPFREAVARLTGGSVDLMAFADHHPFSAGDARAARRRAGTRPLVVTEKDAVKLEAFAEELGEAWVLRQRLSWDWGEQEVRTIVIGLEESAEGPPRVSETPRVSDGERV
jgi:tetraacyldisaccharide 4'-kinase